MSDKPTPEDIVDRLDEIRAEISDVAFTLPPGDLRECLTEAKNQLGMAQDLIEEGNA